MVVLFLAFLQSFTLGVAAATPAETAATVVIYNVQDPYAKGLADFYCKARGVDPSHEIAVSAPLTEEISRSDYDVSLASPIRSEFQQRGYWMTSTDFQNRTTVIATQIRYAVLIRGIPLKIRECAHYPGDQKIQPAPVGGCNAASVDSELSILGLFSSQISGVINNPLYQGKGFDPTVKINPPAPLLMVARLDAPTPGEVMEMILGGLKAENDGLRGWGYADLRSVTDTNYAEGDQWIKAARDSLRRNGIPVISDDLPETFSGGFPITDAAAYYGWYSENIDGPFSKPSFRFLPGAVAVHLHSFSASTLHDPSKGWTAPLIVRGAAASLGNVYEPYLDLTTNLGVLCGALLAGRNLAESFYAAQPVFSWMAVLVGDPLYRPYARLHNPSQPPSVWTDYRSIILRHGGNVLQAAHDLVQRGRITGESLYPEALGAAQMDAGSFSAAKASFREAAKLSKDAKIRFRLVLEEARAFEKEGHPDKGASLLRHALAEFSATEERDLLLLWIARMDPPKPSPSPFPSSFPSPAPHAG